MGSQDELPAPPLKAWRTIRFAVRECWDSLGLLCASSFTLFLGVFVTILVGLGSIAAGITAGCVILGPLFAGACLLAHRVLAHDEPTYMLMWVGFRSLFWRAACLAAIQLSILAVLLANIAFYGSRTGFGFLLASILAWYLLGFWIMNCLYHFPLLVAAAEGAITRDSTGEVRLRMVLRNGLLLVLSTPLYSLALVLFLALTMIPLAVSAVGMALIGASLPAFIGARATRDQLILRGLIPPDPDPDATVVDEVWKLRG